MSGSSKALSRRRLLQGAGAMWLLSVSQVGFAAVSQVVAVRVWPSSTYTRVTVESNRVLNYKQFALSNPERVVVDIEGVNLNSVLKGMSAQIRGDSYDFGYRVGVTLTPWAGTNIGIAYRSGIDQKGLASDVAR